jgi:hypothetical protein
MSTIKGLGNGGYADQVVPGPASSSSMTNVTASATSGVLLAANTSRLHATIWNDSDSALYLNYGGTAIIATACRYKIDPDDTWEMPFRYTGAIHGIWSGSTPAGTGRCAEDS